VGLIEKDFFTKRPEKLIEVWLFKNEKTFRKGAKKFFNDDPDTPYGYYSPSADALVMNIGPGAGTLSHELVHPYMEANFPNVPSWFNEGLASLYEAVREKDGQFWGLPNWRLAGLKRAIRADKLPSFETMTGDSDARFYMSNTGYAQARYLLFYLQEKGLLHRYYDLFSAGVRADPTGYKTLVKLLGDPSMARFETQWQAWALALEEN